MSDTLIIGKGGGNDEIFTPDELAKRIVEYFNPHGKKLEPCKGNGVFLKYMPDAEWCEIKEGIDFFKYDKKVDWIITNPPFSLIRKFLQHSMSVSDNIVFLCPITHFWFKARLRDIKEMDFGIKEIIVIDTPKSFPSSGFQIGVTFIQKNYNGCIEFTDWRVNDTI